MLTLKKALNILQVFLDHKDQLSVPELSSLTGLNISAVYRITSVLREEGYLNRESNRGKYMLGPKFLEFCNLVRDMLKIEDLARPYMMKLHELIDETVHLAIWDGERVAEVEMLHSKQKLRVVPDANLDLPLHCTGSGKIFLAHMAKVELEKYLGKEDRLKSYTPNTITDHTELMTHLSIIKQEGITIDKEEYELGIVDIAAPIKSRIGRVIASLGILIPVSRATTRRVKELAPMIKDCALEISKALGYSS